MKVFISWSGEPSKQIAMALRDWLPLVIQATKKKIYMSDKDNEVGILWGEKISAELAGSNFGIVCLTPGNLESRWIYFEAGALSKLVGQARVVPLLHGLSKTDVGLPLSRFQMPVLDENGIRDLVRSMNSSLDEEERLGEAELNKLFDGMWPALKAELDALPAGPDARRRDDRELLEELLELVRTNSNFFNATPSASEYSDLETARSAWWEPSARWSGKPSSMLDRLRLIAGPNGLVSADSTGVTIRSPRVTADDFTTEEQHALDGAREFLAALGLQLKFVAG